VSATRRPDPPAAARRRLLLPLLLLAALTLSPVAEAHAVLQSASPAPNGRGDLGTNVVEIRFTENVERRYTDAEVHSLAREAMKAGPIQFDDAAANVIRVPVKPLTDGIYVVEWRTLSVDTHTAKGSFVFSVGNATLRYTADPVSHDHSSHEGGAVLGEGAARGVFYAGAFLAFGLPLFALAVLREPRWPRRVLAPAAAGALLAVAGGATVLLAFAARLEMTVAAAIQTEAGGFLAARAGAALVAAPLLAYAAWRRDAPRSVAVAGGAAALAALVATALGSHAAAVSENRLAAVGADLAHLLVAAFWLGGIVGLVAMLPGRDAREAGRLVGRFTPLAIPSVAVLVLTGAYATFLHVQRISDLWSTTYGLAILAKLGLVAVLALLGAANGLWIGPRLARGEGGPRVLRRLVLVETGLLAFALVAAGVLASSPPPDQDVLAGSQGPTAWQRDATTDTTHVTLSIRPDPPTAGLQRITVALHPLEGGALPEGTEVALKVAGPGEREPESLLTPERVGFDQWVAEDAFFTEPGTWRVWVLMQRPDEYRKLVFEVPVVASG